MSLKRLVVLEMCHRTCSAESLRPGVAWWELPLFDEEVEVHFLF